MNHAHNTPFTYWFTASFLVNFPFLSSSGLLKGVVPQFIKDGMTHLVSQLEDDRGDPVIDYYVGTQAKGTDVARRLASAERVGSRPGDRQGRRL